MSPGLMSTVANAAVDPTSGLASIMQLVKGNTKLTPEVLQEMGKILFDPKIIPSKALKRNIMPQLFEIPRANPATTAGFFGGAVGSQQDEINGLLGAR